MSVIKSKLVKSECKHHGITDFYYYESRKSLVCATCIRQKKRIRDGMKRLELNLPYKNRVEKKLPDLTLTKHFIKEYLPFIESIARTYKVKWSEKGILKKIKSTSNDNEFLTELKNYFYNLGLGKMMNKCNWENSNILKYRYGVRENYKSISPEMKAKIRSEMFIMSKESVLIPIQILKDRVDELPIIKNEVKREIKNEIVKKDDFIFKDRYKYTKPDPITGFIGVSAKVGKKETYYTSKFKGKYIGQFQSAFEAAIAYNKEAINAYGDYATDILNTFDNLTYLGCKGVTMKNKKYISIVEFDNTVVYNKTFDSLENAIREYDKEIIKYYGKDSDKLNYKIIENEIVSCSNIPKKYITERSRKNKPSTWQVKYKSYIGTYKTLIEACIAFNNAIVDLDDDELFVKFETSIVKERVKNI